MIGAAAWPAPDLETPTPAVAVQVALMDVVRLDPETARNTRYLYAGNVIPAERAELYAVLSYHINAMSREAIIVRPRKVNSWLWAIDVRDYGWGLERYGLLGHTPETIEPYFHVEPLDGDGKASRPLIAAPWLPVLLAAELHRLTDSSVPVLRADWFFVQTSIQEGRKGHGYYDFLEFKSRADAEKLAGLDREKAVAIYREQGSVIPQSGVALQGRQLFRFATIAGSWWESRDTKGDNAGRANRNAERNLLDDYKHDAEEIVFTLPNRLPGFYLSDAAGVQQNSAPPDIASDNKSASNDHRVHAGMSCIRCHEAGGLKPFSDHFRKLYAAGGGLSFGVTDDKKFRRIRSVYLSPIERVFASDVESYAEAINEACGLTPAGLSAAVARQWSRYVDEPVTLKRLAEEIGTSEEVLVVAMKGHASRKPLVDPVIAGYLAKAPIAARREQVEEFFPLLMEMLREGEQ